MAPKDFLEIFESLFLSQIFVNNVFYIKLTLQI